MNIENLKDFFTNEERKEFLEEEIKKIRENLLRSVYLEVFYQDLVAANDKTSENTQNLIVSKRNKEYYEKSLKFLEDKLSEIK